VRRSHWIDERREWSDANKGLLALVVIIGAGVCATACALLFFYVRLPILRGVIVGLALVVGTPFAWWVDDQAGRTGFWWRDALTPSSPIEGERDDKRIHHPGDGEQ